MSARHIIPITPAMAALVAATHRRLRRDPSPLEKRRDAGGGDDDEAGAPPPTKPPAKPHAGPSKDHSIMRFGGDLGANVDNGPANPCSTAPFEYAVTEISSRNAWLQNASRWKAETPPRLRASMRLNAGNICSTRALETVAVET